MNNNICIPFPKCKPSDIEDGKQCNPEKNRERYVYNNAYGVSFPIKEPKGIALPKGIKEGIVKN